MKFVLFLFCVVCAIINVQGLEFKDCGSSVGKFTKVVVSDCDIKKPYCVLHKGTNATIAIEFTTNENVSTVDTVVHGVIMGIPIPFPLPNSDGCVNSGLSCPLQASGKNNYLTTLPVLNSYPKVSVEVKWELKFGDQTIVCVIIPAKIQ